jgi:hypothetical protein
MSGADPPSNNWKAGEVRKGGNGYAGTDGDSGDGYVGADTTVGTVSAGTDVFPEMTVNQKLVLGRDWQAVYKKYLYYFLYFTCRLQHLFA